MVHEPGTQSSFSRGLDVLIAVARNGQTSVSELADELELARSTVYRYVRSLREYGLIEESQGTYIPGWRLMEVSGQHLTHTRLAELGIDHLRTLTYQTSETSVLAIRAGSHAICLRQVVSPMPERHAFRINELLPLHAGAGQRVLLAFAPRPVLEIALTSLGAEKGSRSDEGQLIASLAAIRKDGYGRSHGELRAGAVAVSVPVIANGEIACSLTLAGPESRCESEAWTRRAVRLLRVAADGLRDQLESGATR